MSAPESTGGDSRKITSKILIWIPVVSVAVTICLFGMTIYIANQNSTAAQFESLQQSLFDISMNLGNRISYLEGYTDGHNASIIDEGVEPPTP